MRVLLAVVEDLYIFAVSTLFGWKTPTPPRQLSLPVHAHTLPLLPIVSPSKENLEKDVREHPQQQREAHDTDVPLAPGALPQKNTIVYAAHAGIHLVTDPNAGEDSIIATLAYGDIVMMLEAGNTWSLVAVGNKKGYIRTADLAHHAAAVYPEFCIGEENGAQHTNTIRLRSVIRDEFSASLSHTPLQAHEYAYYKLCRRGVRIPWPDIRPRTPGTWTHILGLLPDVRITEEPQQGAVMEIPAQKEKAHLAYVEKVFSDESLLLSEADWPDRGIYNERVVTKAEWQLWRPSFIIFS